MNMQDRLEKVKKATEFVIKKLSPIDRVSVVTFSEVANKLCSLRQINKDSQRDILSLVNGMTSANGQNILDGLEMALQVLTGRKFTENRSVGIIIMSSDEQDGGRDATGVEVANIPVYTFGFGTGCKDNLTKPHVLEAIARKSAGGTYSDVRNGDDLSVAFAHCFVGLMTVAVQDLKLIMSPENMSTVENVYAGDHEQSRDDYTVSVVLGNLYDKETRKVLVHVLPPVSKVVGLQVLKVAYKYRNELGKERKSTPLYASKKQIQNFTQEEIDDLMDEVIHLERAHIMNEDTVTPSSEVATKGDGRNQKQAKSLHDVHTNSLREDNKENVEEDDITLSSKVAARVDRSELPLVSTLCMDTYDKQADSFYKNRTNSVPGEEDNVPEETITSSFRATGKDIVKEGSITPSFEVANKGDMAKLPLISTPYMETPPKQGGTFEKDFMNPLPANKMNVKEKAIPPSSEVESFGDMENLPLSSTSCTDQDNLKEETIKPYLEVATKDEENAKKETTPLSSEVTETCDLEKPPSTLCTDEDDLREETITPSSELATIGDVEKPPFHMDYINPLPTTLENVKKKTNPSTSEVATTGNVEKPPLHFTPYTDEGNLNKETNTPSFRVKTKGEAGKQQKQGEPFEKDDKNPSPTYKEDMEKEIITAPFKVAARGYMEKLVILFTKLLMLFNLHNRTHQEGESLEQDHTTSLPTNEKNVNEENTQSSSKVATSGVADQKQAESSGKNHPNLLPTEEDDLRDRTITAPPKVTARGYMEKLVFLFTKLLMFFNLRNRTHQEGESFEENDNDENTQPSSKVATSSDAHKKQAESSDKNHPNLLPPDEDDLKDGTITTSSNLAARVYIEKLLLFFTPRMDTNQRQTESFQTDDTNSLSADEHHEKEHGNFKSKLTRKFMGSLTGISNSVATQNTRIWTSIQELGATSFAYCYSPIPLVQDALRSPPSEFRTIMQVALVSVAAAAVLYMFCFSHAEFRDLAPLNILYGFGLYNPFCLLDISIISVVVLLIAAYQVYYQPLFKFIDKLAARFFPNKDFIIKEHDIPLPSGFKPFELNLFRLVWRTIFVIITTIILMLLPFFKEVVDIVGAFGFWPLTVYYPVDMYIVRKNIPEWSSRWIFLQILGVLCLIIGTAAAAGSFAAVVTDLKVCKPFQTSY